MRFTTIVSTLLCASAAFGATVNRRLHQAVYKRSTSDLCVSLDLNLDLLDHVFGHLDACVCLSTVGLFIEENATVKAAVKKFGVAKVRENLLTQINRHHKKKKCTYPPHGKPAPSHKCGPNSDPCTFTCTDGFVANLKKRTCDCPAPKRVWNGKCEYQGGQPGHPQPSGKPHQPPQHQPQPQPPHPAQPQPQHPRY